MADVYAVFGTLLALGIVFPGMLTAWWLLFPAVVDRAGSRIASTPWRSLGLGLLCTLALTIPIGVLLALPVGGAKLVGAVLLGLALVFASLGAAGVAAVMGKVWQERSEGKASGGATFVRGAVALELAAAFPLLGWFVVIPITTLVGFGGAAFAALNWMPPVGADQASPEAVMVHDPQSA
jgi:hypothetical protein